jgi:hypothetical protein
MAMKKTQIDVTGSTAGMRRHGAGPQRALQVSAEDHRVAISNRAVGADIRPSEQQVAILQGGHRVVTSTLPWLSQDVLRNLRDEGALCPTAR